MDNLKTDIELATTSNKLTLQFNSVCYKSNRKDSKKYILNNVCGHFETGRLSAILGPSGAGKTTLLNVLAGFKYVKVSGNILLNGQKRNINEFRQLSSYITQEFTLLSFLTTFETMKFAADLKLNNKISNEKKIIIINNVIKLLNLEKCTNTHVSKMSGGEKKRLSIGIELISDPPIMFLDEPTSGLDSVSSLQIISHLHQLAKNGRMIVCVIHQPGSRLMKLFHDMLVLADGQSVYSGPINNVIQSFDNIGINYPDFYNIADFDVASEEYGKECLTVLINNNAIKYLSILEHSDVDEKMSLLSSQKCIKQNNNPFKTKFFSGLKTLTFRSLVCTWRDLFTTHVRIWCHIIVGALIGAVFYDIGNDAAKILSNSSCLFFFTLFIFFANAMPSVLTCPLETSVFLREHLNGWYSITSYFVSKLISDVPLQIICPTLFSIIAYYLTGQPMELERFSKTWLITLLTGILGHVVGVLAGSCFKIEMALFLVPASCIPMLIFSGFFIRPHELSVYFKPLTNITYFRYSFEGLVQAVYGNNRTDLICSEPFCYFRAPYKFLQTLDMGNDAFGIDIIALLIWIVIFQILLYISLIIKVKKAQ